MDFGTRATIPRKENPQTKLNKQDFKFLPLQKQKTQKQNWIKRLNIEFNLSKNRKSNTKFDKQSLKFVATPSAQTKKSKNV